MVSEQAFGVTPPMSVDLPTESQLRASDSLIEELRRQKTFESQAATDKRYVYWLLPGRIELLTNPPGEKFSHLLRRSAMNSFAVSRRNGNPTTMSSFEMREAKSLPTAVSDSECSVPDPISIPSSLPQNMLLETITSSTSLISWLLWPPRVPLKILLL